MRVAVLADVHGNLAALEAVLEEANRLSVDLIVVAGDVLPGPQPAECFARLDAVTVPLLSVRGNGERETLAAVDGHELTTVPVPYRPAVEWGARQLDARTIAALRTWPLALEVAVTGVGAMVVCHATPRDDAEIVTRLTPEARMAEAFGGVSAPLVVCGHTHMAFDRQVGQIRVVNAGSVGMPFGMPGAHWLLIDEAGPQAMHTAYDLEAAAARIRTTAYPGAEEFAARYVLHPPSERDMLAAFST